MSARDFEPVFLPDDREFDGRLSVTFGRLENVCSRAGFLYLKYRGGAASHPLERGSALHRVLELATREATERGEPTIPPEVVKDIVNAVLADPAYRCPIEEHDYLRESAYRWAEEATFDPRTLIACETMFALEINGFTVRGVIDRADLLDDGKKVVVRDYKSSRSMPPYEDLSRTLRDGRVAAKAYQLVLYALLLAFGVPVVREDGREVPEPFGVADHAQEFELHYEYPGIDVAGEMGRRTVTLTRLELVEYMASLEGQMARVSAALASGRWPATRGSHCAECPARHECPIPAELRSWAGEVNTVEQAVEAAARLDFDRDLYAARRKELFEFVKTLPGQRLRFGRDLVIEPVPTVKRTIRDKDGMRDAIERARQFGEPFDLGDWEKVSRSAPLSQRRLTEEELAVEAAAPQQQNPATDDRGESAT